MWRSPRLARPVRRWQTAGALAFVALGFGCRPSTFREQTQPEAVAASETEEEAPPVTAADVPVPKDYVEAVQRLGAYRDAIRDSVLQGDPAKAHRPLDETDIALERLPALARSSGVRRRDWEAIVEAGDDLGEALGAIHAAIDAGQSPDYATYAKDIDDALARLEALGDRGGESRNDPTEEEKP
ncbi:MAG TPA: hypothetical protein VHC22_27875 [Pirellulales bacterium]|nr:hypothetical protein [Pirellulales bacterium]